MSVIQDPAMVDSVRAVRLEAELRFRARPERVFSAISGDTRAWFPHTYGGDRVRAVVMEPRVGGRHYEDWGDDIGHLYGQVTVFDPPRQLATRGRVMPGTILDTEYTFEPEGEETVLRMSKVAVGPMTDEEAAGIRKFGDISRFEDALRRVVEGDRGAARHVRPASARAGAPADAVHGRGDQTRRHGES